MKFYRIHLYYLRALIILAIMAIGIGAALIIVGEYRIGSIFAFSGAILGFVHLLINICSPDDMEAPR